MDQGTLANLNTEQARKIDQLEAELGIVLVAYDGYKQENEQGQPQA